MTYPSHHDPSHLYFVTASICGWKPLFNNPAYAEIVLNSLDWLRRNQHMKLFAFTIMPTHLHAILKPEGNKIGEVVQKFGSYTAHAILAQLRTDGQDELIQFFSQKRRDNSRQHSIWQDIQAQNIFSTKVLEQKLEYVHTNPVNKNWKLVSDRADYRYSSACYFDRAITPIIEIDDVIDWLSTQ